MKYPILALLLIASHVFGDVLKLGFYPAFAEEGGPTAEAMWDLEKSADRVVWHDKAKNFDLGLGAITDGARSPIEFNFDQIKSFLEGEKHKDLIVVYFDKTVMWNEKEFVSERAREVSKQMLDVGYKRVIVLGAHSMGVHYVADTNLETKKAEQAGTGQPATRPESKSEGSDKPEPEAEGRSR
jgi:hypothetical protein